MHLVVQETNNINKTLWLFVNDYSRDPENFFTNWKNISDYIIISRKVVDATTNNPIKNSKVTSKINEKVKPSHTDKNRNYKINTGIKRNSYVGNENSDFKIIKNEYVDFYINRSLVSQLISQNFLLTKEIASFSDGKLYRRTKDSINLSSGIPSDTYVRITPSRYQVDGDRWGLRCKVNSNVS